MSRERARETISPLSARLGIQPSGDETDSRLALPDDHPLWAQHALRERGNDYLGWNEHGDISVAEAFYHPVAAARRKCSWTC